MTISQLLSVMCKVYNNRDEAEEREKPGRASKVKAPAQEIKFLEIRWHDGCCHVPRDVVRKIATVSPPANKKGTQAFLGLVGFWRMHILGYSQLVSPRYQVTQKKNYFEQGLEQQQAFEQIKQEIDCAVALGPLWTEPAAQNVLYTAAGELGLTGPLTENIRRNLRSTIRVLEPGVLKIRSPLHPD
ncbi:hypothetical protein llap_2393 [Limosa lapponica baueri]|uniref:Uncharacterized protein n=1 Tax=Limosa lapponica baueri TaxID=1758121 RepID=A0A2I0UML9_LIMLA|nr:hypothetical protein llap_2393 [Limosa lapponica baueri]